MLRATALLLSASLVLLGLALAPDAAAHACFQGSRGPPCDEPFCPDNGRPHLHLGPDVGPLQFTGSICLLPTLLA